MWGVSFGLVLRVVAAGFGVLNLVFGVWGVGSRAQGVGYGVCGVRFGGGGLCLGLKVLVWRVLGLGFRI